MFLGPSDVLFNSSIKENSDVKITIALLNSNKLTLICCSEMSFAFKKPNTVVTIDDSKIRVIVTRDDVRYFRNFIIKVYFLSF